MWLLWLDSLTFARQHDYLKSNGAAPGDQFSSLPASYYTPAADPCFPTKLVSCSTVEEHATCWLCRRWC